MLNPLFFLISRLNIAGSPHEFNLQISDRSGLEISHSKVFSSDPRIIDLLKGTASVILCDLPFVKWHVQITTIPFKPLPDLIKDIVDILIYLAGN